LLAFLFLSVPAAVKAGEPGGLVPCGSPPLPPCQLCHLFELIGRIVNMIVWQIVPAIATIMIIYAGIKFFTALGNPGEIQKIKNLFFGIVAGFLIIVLAWSITVALYGAMGAGTPVGWWEIENCPTAPR